MKDYEYLDATNEVSPSNLRAIYTWLFKNHDIPTDALEALEGLYSLAYDGKPVSWQCRHCKETFETPMASGKIPSLCTKVDCQRTANRERVARHRANKKAKVSE